MTTNDTLTLTLTRDELLILQLALGDRIEAMETECWRSGDDDTASTHNPLCGCYFNTEASKAEKLAQKIETRIEVGA